MQAIEPWQLDYPAMMPPNGTLPNLEHPHSTGSILISVGAVTESLMIIFLGTRLYTKTFIVKKFGWDDLTCTIGTILASVYYALAVCAVKIAHYGTHQWDITLREYMKDDTFLIAFFSAVLPAPTLFFIKTTFFILFYQLFRPDRKLRWAIHVGFAANTLFYLVMTILSFYSMTRRPGESWIEHMTLNPVSKIMMELAIGLPLGGLILDLYILILPIVGIFNLQLPLHRKFGAAFVFFAGSIAVVASILALYFRIGVWKNSLDDLTYHQMPVLLTSVVEMTLGVCVSCMPSFSRMLRHTLPPFEELRSRFSNFTSTLRSSKSKNSTIGSQFESGKFGGFVQVNEQSTVNSDYEFQDIRPSKTYIYGGNGGHESSDGIHLKHELRQEYHRSGEHIHPGTARKEATIRDMV